MAKDHNPRGNLWAKDSSKMGQKMLEKMGWKSGQGLGVHEDGIVEPILPRFKTDKLGVGRKKNMGDACNYSSDLDKLLQQLNANAGNSKPQSEHNSDEEKEPKQRKSMEQRAKSARKYYFHKSVKSKDLSRYSENDMLCIFGKQKEGGAEDSAAKQEAESKDDEATLHVNKGSMSDYFAQAMAKKALSKKILQPIESLDETKDDDVTECDTSKKKKKKKSKDREREVEAPEQCDSKRQRYGDDEETKVKRKRKTSSS